MDDTPKRMLTPRINEVCVACRESKMGTCIMVGRPVFIRYYEKKLLLTSKMHGGYNLPPGMYLYKHKLNTYYICVY